LQTKFILIVSVVFITLQGCDGSRDSKREIATNGGKATATVRASKLRPISQEEAKSFASKVEDAAADGDAAALNQLIDWNTIVQDALQEVEAEKGIREGFIEGFLSSTQSATGPSSVIAGAAKKGGSFRLLNIPNVSGAPRPLFRLLATSETGLNYIQLTLRRFPDGTIRATDVYQFATGEPTSKTVHRLFLAAAATQGSRSFLDRLTNKESALVKSWSDVSEIRRRTQAGQHKEALAIYMRLPKSIRMEKSVMLQGLMAAQGLGEATYLKVLADFEAAFPNDPCLDLLSIDAYTLKADYPRLVAVIDRLDKTVGGDPHLGALRANALLESGDTAGAKTAAERAIREDPDMINAHWVLLASLLERKEFAESADVLDEIASRFHMEFDLENNDSYAEFVKSPEYDAWLKRQPLKASNSVEADSEPTPESSAAE
jgi:hypothetical protein